MIKKWHRIQSWFRNRYFFDFWSIFNKFWTNFGSKNGGVELGRAFPEAFPTPKSNLETIQADFFPILDRFSINFDKFSINFKQFSITFGQFFLAILIRVWTPLHTNATSTIFISASTRYTHVYERCNHICNSLYKI